MGTDKPDPDPFRSFFLGVRRPPLYLPQDFDPSGEFRPLSFRRSVSYELGLRDAHPDRDDLSLMGHAGRFKPVFPVDVAGSFHASFHQYVKVSRIALVVSMEKVLFLMRRRRSLAGFIGNPRTRRNHASHRTNEHNRGTSKRS